MKLIIVESPSKTKTIQKYLGAEYKVMASRGHVCDLPERTLGVDVEHNFEPQYVINPDKKEVIKKLKEAMDKSECVYLATDPDREGEAISWHLKNVLGIGDGKVRIEFNEISKNAVLKALDNPREIKLNLVDAQQARRVLDRLVGYKISPVLARKIKNRLSAGRVQSVALRMVVDREREIEAFVPEEYWNVTAMLKKADDDRIFKALLSDFNGKKFKINSSESMAKVREALKGASYHVDSVKRGESKGKAQPPFTTSTLTQEASTRFSLSAPQVMQIAQKLYEGVEIEGEGMQALVTYIRTDSVRVAAEAQAKAKEYITQKYGAEYAPAKYNFYKSKGSAQDAHEAIRPIDLARSPESLSGRIEAKFYKVYKLIYDRFVASQMSDAVYDTLNVRVRAETEKGEFGFKVSGKTVRFKGYTAVYKQEESEEEGEKTLPNLSEGELLELKDMKEEQKFTKPPVRFTDASIVKAMEENGIGRPSTYASIVAVLFKREYVERFEKKFMKPTELGTAVCDMMMKYFPKVMDYKFTANMESDLDKIEEGGIAWQKIVADFYPDFIKSVLDSLRDGEKMKLKDEVSDVICEKCGANMVVKEGKYGKFLACPNYPDCKNIKPIQKAVAKCPRCGRDVYQKRSRTGKTFYGCSGYPECDFISWEIPAPILCPACKAPMIQQKGKEGLTYKCTNKACGHSEIVNEKAED